MPTVISPATLSFSGSVPRNVQCLASGVPLRLGANRIVVTLLSLSPYPTCLPPVHALPGSASLREIFRGRLQRNRRSSAGCHRRRFTFPTPMDIPLNTSRSLMKRRSASLSVRFQAGRRDKRWFNRAERTTRSPFEFCSGSRVGCNPAHELAVLRRRQLASTGTWIVG
jgi:hypothetical protein